jgi:hypothetical protein
MEVREDDRLCGEWRGPLGFKGLLEDEDGIIGMTFVSALGFGLSKCSVGLWEVWVRDY